ncbi:MAG: cysteine protease [Salinisphaeraceae bacterium]|nr:cysteine protease [Salinisphaeraceae bacterium]
MWLHTQCDVDFELDVPTPFILMLRPRSGGQQWIAREAYELTPSVPAREYTDDYGNLCQRLVAPRGAFAIRTSADVKVVDEPATAPGAPFTPVEVLPDAVLIYLLPSRYCESELFLQMAQEITGGCEPGYDQVAAIEQWVARRIAYLPGSSAAPLTAAAVNSQGSGVCRDLAHLGIALCRALTIPSRFVVGYLDGLDPMDMHAWFEAYVDGAWYSFDATQARRRAGYVAVGYGRDAADVAVYNQFGPLVRRSEMRVSVSRIDASGRR